MGNVVLKPPVIRANAKLKNDRRYDSILRLAHRAFVETGFEGTSMQDVARKAQMSVGNLYHYFPSKMALVKALIVRHFDELDGELDVAAGCPDPLAAFKATMHNRIAQRHTGNGTLNAEIAAGVSTTPELATIVSKRMEGITHSLARIIGPACNLNEASVLKRARAASLIMHGAMTSPQTSEWGEEGLADLALWTLDRVIQNKAEAR